MSPAEIAARDAEQEAEQQRAAAIEARCLEDQSRLLYDQATAAIEAYQRAAERAKAARQLADHDGGGFNAWSAG